MPGKIIYDTRGNIDNLDEKELKVKRRNVKESIKYLLFNGYREDSKEILIKLNILNYIETKMNIETDRMTTISSKQVTDNPPDASISKASYVLDKEEFLANILEKQKDLERELKEEISRRKDLEKELEEIHKVIFKGQKDLEMKIKESNIQEDKIPNIASGNIRKKNLKSKK